MKKEISKEESQRACVSRRRFLGWASAFASSLYIGFENARAGWFYSTKPVEGIPQSWVDQKGLDVLRYANYIKGLKLVNVTPRMVLSPHFKTRGRTGNSLPPRYMWKNIAPILKVIDLMASRMKRPVDDLLSIYRSPAYNRAVRGKSRSYHMQNIAVDMRFKGVSPRTVSAIARRLRSEGVFNGGIGTYSSFTHVDTRGSKADW
ncbi:YcbK family protein [Rubritalea spongiae]|uniref:YcbK family protein n=2 Tax=Rubritalea spongiae TaxID=430797 RepID=A0ABW5E7K3_9BACT